MVNKKSEIWRNISNYTKQKILKDNKYQLLTTKSLKEKIAFSITVINIGRSGGQIIIAFYNKKLPHNGYTMEDELVPNLRGDYSESEIDRIIKVLAPQYESKEQKNTDKEKQNNNDKLTNSIFSTILDNEDDKDNDSNIDDGDDELEIMYLSVLSDSEYARLNQQQKDTDIEEIEEEEEFGNNSIRIGNSDYDINENCVFYPLRLIYPELEIVPPIPMTINEISDELERQKLNVNLRFHYPIMLLNKNNDYEMTAKYSKKHVKSFDYLVNDNHAIMFYNSKYHNITGTVFINTVEESLSYDNRIIELYYNKRVRQFLIISIDNKIELNEIKYEKNVYDKFMDFCKNNSIIKCHKNYKGIFIDSIPSIERWSYDGISEPQAYHEVDKSGSYMDISKWTNNKQPNGSFHFVNGNHYNHESACLVIYKDTSVIKSWNLPINFTNVIPVPIIKALKHYGYNVDGDADTLMCYSWVSYDFRKEENITKEESRFMTGLFVSGGVDGKMSSTGLWSTTSEYELYVLSKLSKYVKEIKLNQENRSLESVLKHHRDGYRLNYKIFIEQEKTNYVQHYSWAVLNNALHMIDLINCTNKDDIIGGNRDAIFYKKKPQKIPEGFKYQHSRKEYALPTLNNYIRYSQNLPKNIQGKPTKLTRINIVMAPAGTGKNKGMSSLIKKFGLTDVVYTAPTHKLVDSQLKYDSPWDVKTGHSAFSLLDSKNISLPNIAIIDEAQLYCRQHIETMLKSGITLIIMYDENQCTALYSGYTHLYKEVIKPMKLPTKLITKAVCNPNDNLRFTDEKTKKFFNAFINETDIKNKIKLAHKNIKTLHLKNNDIRDIMYDKNSSIISVYHKDSIHAYSLLKNDDIIKVKKRSNGNYETAKMGDCIIRSKFDHTIPSNIEAHEISTVYSSQGSTYDGNLYILNGQNIKDYRILYTALSRGRSIKNIYFVKITDNIENKDIKISESKLTEEIPKKVLPEYATNTHYKYHINVIDEDE